MKFVALEKKVPYGTKCVAAISLNYASANRIHM